ncbi:reverse transcriptase domain-containing protein [Tanacetum coccineum]
MVTPADKKISNKFCEFHNDKGHSTDECMQLKKQIEELPWHRATRQKVTLSFAQVNEITFPPLSANKGTEGPLVIEAEIGGHAVHRMYVDGGSSMEILYEHCFNRLRPEIKSQMVPATTSLTGSSPSPYNDIIGRLGIREIQAVPSTDHGMLKFPVDGGVVTIRSTILTPNECATIMATSKDSMKKTEGGQKNLKVAIHHDFPDQEVALRGTLSIEGRADYAYSMKWYLDGYAPVRQKKRGQALERAKAIQAEVQKLVKVGIICEVYYHGWLSNPVMVKKHDGSWRMCVDFTNLNKACPQDCYPLPKIDWKVESLCGYPFKCFLDAYKGYHQIQMAEMDEEKTAFHTPHGVYCYTKMPFGLKNAGATYQRLVDKAFEKQVGQNLEVYVDDLVIKSHTEAELLRDMKIIRVEKDVLGDMIGPEGIKPCPEKIEVVLQLPSPRTIKEVQSLNGKLAGLNRFLSKSAEKSLPLFKTLKKCVKKSDFHWTPEAEQAFKQLKQHISELPMLVAPRPKEELILYLSASQGAVGAVLITKRDSIQTPVYFGTSKGDCINGGIHVGGKQHHIQNRTISKGPDPTQDFLVEKQRETLADMSERRPRKNQGRYSRMVHHVLMVRAVRGITSWATYCGTDGGTQCTSPRSRYLKKSTSQKEKEMVAAVVEEEGRTRMIPITEYLKDGVLPDNKKEANKLRIKARQYELMDGIMYRRLFLRLWLRPVPRNPQQPLTPITSPWPFYKWGIDIRVPCSEGPGDDQVLISRLGLLYKWIEARLWQNISGGQVKTRRKLAAIREAKEKSKMMSITNARVRGEHYSRPGDYVYRSYEASHTMDGGKLGPKWEGPYEVTEVLRREERSKLRSMDGCGPSCGRPPSLARTSPTSKKCYL